MVSSTDRGASSITVAIRVRPFTIREAAQLQPTDDGKLFLGDGSLAAAPAPKLNQRGLRSVIKVVDDRCLVFDPPEDNPVQKFSRSVVPAAGKKVKDQVFAFDRIFDDNATQAEVYEGTTRNLLDSVLDGYNATVFAYGATGCGKTHTITGTAQQPGIIFMTMQELFEKIQDRSQDKATEVSLSYLEIYNETIRDLLVPGGSRQGLMLREDSNQSVTVAGLTSHHPRDVQEVMDMIVQGNEYRTVSPTEANATSSRSHAVLQINVAQKDRNADINEPHTMATLSIIDLAGSERASATKNRGDRLLEGANINKSLLALGSCINALCDPRKRNHVPYRNSKLTRLLKFSLGGNCKTVMIVCVSPSSAHFDETQNTLRYANRAKNIQTKVTRNVFNVNRHVKDFLVKIDEQMALINELKAQQRDAENLALQKFRRQADRRDAAAREGVQRLRAAYDNSAAERQEKLANMKRLRAFERRIGLLGAWIAAFDGVCEARCGGGGGGGGGSGGGGSDEEASSSFSMPPNLAAMKKTARGIMLELENSRSHIHQKLDKCNWERAVDTALQHSIRQLSETGGDAGGDCGEAAGLAREAELLKANFARDAYREVLEQEKGRGDSAPVQTLLTAQFDILASLSETLSMNEDDAVAHAKQIIRRLLDTGFAAASRVIRTEGGPPPPPSAGGGGGGGGSGRTVEAFPPTRKGTPKRRPPTLNGHHLHRESHTTRSFAQPNFGPSSSSFLPPPPPPPSSSSSPPPLHPFPSGHGADASTMAASPPPSQQVLVSPIKASPRRRKVHPARKGVSFTPVKRKSPSKRAVRWRDDDGEEGTLADFEKTPKKFDSTPEPPASSVASPPLRAVDADPATDLSPSPSSPTTTTTTSAHHDVGNDSGVSDSGPSPDPSRPSGLPPPRPNRFQAGFLSKSRLSSAQSRQGRPPESPEPGIPIFSLRLAGSSSPSDADGQRPTPLRVLSAGRSSNLSPPGAIAFKRNLTPRRSLSSMLDDNQPPSGLVLPRMWSHSGASSASDTDSSPGIDPLKVRSALQAAKRQRERRMSALPSTTAGGGGGGGGADKRLSFVGSFSERGSLGAVGSAGGSFVSRHSSGAGAANTASASNGISRRRRSMERRRSPPMPCLSTDEGRDRSFTSGQARRMNLGSRRESSSHNGNGGGATAEGTGISDSPHGRTPSGPFMFEKGRRSTIAAAVGAGSVKGRPGATWR